MKEILLCMLITSTLVSCGGGSNLSSETAGTGETITGAAAGDGSQLTIINRSGQTFITWPETSPTDGYHVYRHTSPITPDNLQLASRLTGRWGPLDENTSVDRFGSEASPDHFVIEDLALPLSDDVGLFVHTTQSDQQGAAYYAITRVRSGVEDLDVVPGELATIYPVEERVDTPAPVLADSLNDGKGRLYTHYMDYSRWNPTLNGYAFSYSVALPFNYDGSREYSLRLYLHAFGEPQKYLPETEFQWPVIQVFPHEPGFRENTWHSWWYGHSAEHNYNIDGDIPRSGVIENFTEQRVLAAINYLVNESDLNIDADRVHAFGHSMGASGVVSMGLRYPNVFAGVYASQPMMNYGASPLFQENYSRVWGERASNLPIVNEGEFADGITEYGEGGSNPNGVYDWMNHFQQIEQRKGDRFAYLMVDHGKADGTIDWATQAEPVARSFNSGKVGFSRIAIEGAGHSWMSFGSVVGNVFGILRDDEFGWRYPRTLSFPAIGNASASGSLQPTLSGDDRYNTNIEWATPINNFDESIVETADSYAITLRSLTIDQTADITPRNTNLFRPSSGAGCSWNARSITTDSTISSGNMSVDFDGLVTATGVPVTASGSRLTISC